MGWIFPQFEECRLILLVRLQVEPGAVAIYICHYGAETQIMRKIKLTKIILLAALGLVFLVNMAFAKTSLFYSPTWRLSNWEKLSQLLN